MLYRAESTFVGSEDDVLISSSLQKIKFQMNPCGVGGSISPLARASYEYLSSITTVPSAFFKITVSPPLFHTGASWPQ
jgi:hypothetical protein